MFWLPFLVSTVLIAKYIHCLVCKIRVNISRVGILHSFQYVVRCFIEAITRSDYDIPLSMSARKAEQLRRARSIEDSDSDDGEQSQPDFEAALEGEEEVSKTISSLSDNKSGSCAAAAAVEAKTAVASTQEAEEGHDRFSMFGGGRGRSLGSRLFGNRSLPTQSTYLVKSKYTVDTRDYEDHTFNGIMFDLEVKSSLPVHEIVLEAIWVRGALGRMKIFTTPETHRGKQEDAAQWTEVHSGTYPASEQKLSPMLLDPPIALHPGQSLGIYVHSQEEGDQGIVYNNQRGTVTYVDRHLKIKPGCAHLSPQPFSGRGWGWGTWRMQREFVGRISYGCRWLLWSPVNHKKFPASFRRMVMVMLLCNSRHGSAIGMLPPDLVMHILNLCSWDWAGLDGLEDAPSDREPGENENEDEGGTEAEPERQEGAEDGLQRPKMSRQDVED
eukprot:g30245.t1